jgi:DNA primase
LFFMARYTKESVQRLRETVDIVDLISRYVPLKRAGAAWKGLCPFHDEKTPSFTVNKATKHYHCFGCGAHGDSVAFLMEHERLEFKQALEFLSERFGTPLEVDHQEEERGVPKVRLRAANEAASHFFHTYLLHADEASGARTYMQNRGFSLSFLQAFSVGYAPSAIGMLHNHLRSAGFSDEELVLAGLLARHEGRVREFFSERITFPILDTLGHTIGFSARKWREETFGGKYINTKETDLFTKSRVLFGLFYSKKRMMKDRVACIVEGQLDALRLIEAGFDFTVATLGTAFGAPHVEQLRAMGIEEVYLAFDQDKAGMASAEKAGHLLMKKGVGVKVVCFSEHKDPDELLASKGKGAFFQALSESSDYIPFMIERSKELANWSSPREKDAAVRHIADLVREWENPIHVYETLRQISALAKVPESLLGVGSAPAETAASLPPSISEKSGGADLIIELDLVRWLLLAGPEQGEIVQECARSLKAEDFVNDVPRQLFCLSIEKLQKGEHPDFMSFAEEVDTESVSAVMQTLLGRRQRPEKAPALLFETIKRIKERNWLSAREKIRRKMEDPSLSEEALVDLARKFDELMKSPPSLPAFKPGF